MTHLIEGSHQGTDIYSVSDVQSIDDADGRAVWKS